jgi:hypothetical protein
MTSHPNESSAEPAPLRPWRSRAWPGGCRGCGTSEQPHMGQGYCNRCYRPAVRTGLIVQRNRTGRLRVRGGVRERYCHDERLWRPEANFRTTRRTTSITYETICKECARRRRQASYRRRRQAIIERNRRWRRNLYEATQQADAAASTAPPRVPTAVIAAWISEWRSNRPSRPSIAQVAAAAGVNERLLQRVINGEMADVSFDVADRIATLTDQHEALYAYLRAGVPTWSRHSEHCLRCGRFDRPHYSSGYCLRCYAVAEWHRRHGKPAPPPREERWTMQAPAGCKRCRGRQRPHIARGLCQRCYNDYARAARRLQSNVSTVLDQAGYPRAVQNPSVFDRAAKSARRRERIDVSA